MRKWIVLLWLLLGVVTVGSAQDVPTLEYGDTVRGEITNAVFEVAYQFLGNPDDVVVIEMLATDNDTELRAPEILLLDAEGNLLADSINNIGIEEAVLVFQVPEEAFYTVIATREDGRGGDDTGEYTLTLFQPPIIKADDVAESRISNVSRPLYFVVESEDDFTLTYEKQAGDFFPQVSVSTLPDNNGELEEVAIASGDVLSLLTFGVFEGGQPHIVIVERALFDFAFDTITADFTLQIDLR